MAENFKIIEEKENPLFNRREIKVEVENQVAPSNEKILTLLSDKFSSAPETIRIQKIDGRFGSQIFVITANIYKTKEDLISTEAFSKKEKEARAKAEEAAAAPVEEVKEEPKVEEAPVEEAKSEENTVPAPAEEKPAEEEKKEAPAEEPKAEEDKE